MADYFSLVTATNAFLCRPRFRGHSAFHLYPSEASVRAKDEFGDEVTLGACLREVYYRCIGTVPTTPHSAYSEGVAAMGKAVENCNNEYWKQMGLYVASSVRFQNETFNISGELDTILRNPDSNRLFGVEQKTLYGYYAQSEIIGTKHKNGRPKMSHLMQTIVYAYEFKNTLEYMKIFYTERGNGEKIEYNVCVCEDELPDMRIITRALVDDVPVFEFTVDDIYARYKLANEMIMAKELPDREFEIRYSNEKVDRLWEQKRISKSAFEAFKKNYKNGSTKVIEKERPGDFQCKYCKYSELCWTGTQWEGVK